jgi:hypothetical protein
MQNLSPAAAPDAKNHAVAATPQSVTSRRERPTYDLRIAVERLPTHTKEAMLRGISTNRIIVGAYVDTQSGGICPMLAAHRNGARTSVANFARAWDTYTCAKRPRRATRREVRTLRSLLEWSLDIDTDLSHGSLAEAAAQIRAEREQFRCATAEPRPTPADTGDRHRGRELKLSRDWAWMRPTKRLDEYKDLLAAAEEQLSEQRAAEILPDPELVRR